MDKIWEELYNAARAVQCGRRISEYVEAGELPQLYFQIPGRYTPESALIRRARLVSALSATRYSI